MSKKFKKSTQIKKEKKKDMHFSMTLKWLNSVTLVNRQTGQQLYTLLHNIFLLLLIIILYSFFLHAERNLLNSKIDSCVEEAKFSKYTKNYY
jgi:hypothetical protein